ncbi:MAG: tellurite resistance protein permease, partial [Candidatus Dormiibacterota bacterium]
VVLWGFGAILYVVLMASIVPRLLLAELRPDDSVHPYWITMGATAISVFAGARILALPAHLPIPAPTLAGIAFLLWAFGSWWIPLLIALECWRYLLRRIPLVYDPSLWDVVFPLGMYAAASQALGRVTESGPLGVVAKIAVWVAAVAWSATFVAMVVGVRRLRR